MEGPPETGRSCQMKTLYINFKELGWHVSYESEGFNFHR